jgi:PTS system nitrogen regulatory IIA component
VSDADFDIDRLAAYLHLTPAQVAKLADRGNIPGRKVAGQWRFSPADVHHWLEDRIGLSDDDELVEMENVLGRAAGPDEERPCIATMLSVEAIAVPLQARTRGSVIAEMAQLAARTGWLWDAGRMADAVRAREDMQPTALDIGVALLHPRRPLAGILAQPFLAMGRTSQGIPFGNARGGLTDIFFLICSIDDSGHLRTLARLSRLISDPTLLDDLRRAESPSAAHRLIAEREETLKD